MKESGFFCYCILFKCALLALIYSQKSLFPVLGPSAERSSIIAV